MHERGTQGVPAPDVPILVVDDLRENILVLEALISREGRQVVTAGSGEEALERLAEQEFALVLLDVQLPGISGFEVAARMRAVPTTEHTPIIFVTATEHAEDDVFQGYDAGAVDYLLRPVNPRILRSKVAVFAQLWGQRKIIEMKNAELERYLKEIETLQGLIPICSNCKKVRNDDGYWERVETYITRRSGAQFSHAICAECEAELYPDD
jgi:CheY-like chemotaxis protein